MKREDGLLLDALIAGERSGEPRSFDFDAFKARKRAGYDRAQIAAQALRAFFKIADAWNPNEQEQMRLLRIFNLDTLYRWKSEGDELGRDTLERISYLLGIFQAINTLLPDPTRVDIWMREPNRRSAADRQSRS